MTLSTTYVALDLETTGLNPDRDAIFEIGLVRFRGNEILEKPRSWLVNPGRPLPAYITQLTGVTNRDLASKPSLSAVLPEVWGFIGDYPVVAHNAPFDLAFLRRAGLNLTQPAIDTFELASILFPNASSYSLGALAKRLGIEAGEAHRAEADALCVARLLPALVEVAARLPLPTLAEIVRLARTSDWSLRPIFEAAEKAAARTALTRGSPARRRAADEDLLPLLSPAAAHGWRPAEPLEPLEQPEPLDVEALVAFLEPGGPLSQLFPGYEHRPPQVEMLAAVAEAFNNGQHLLIEAGTGTGKSLAYLLPAILWAVQNRRRVVISTNTINLQDQLIDKDVPALVQIFNALATQHRDRIEPRFLRLAEQGRQVRVALLKGRNNYLCPYRLNLMRSRTDLTVDELRVLARVLVWLGQTTTGDRAELFLPSGRDLAVWSRLASESGVCTAERCETKGRGRCFFYRRHQEAEAAHLIVVNHALLLSDVATANRVLPEYRHLIVDEAHHLEEATTNQLGFQASEEGLQRLLREVYPEGGEGSGGLLLHLVAWAAGLAPEVRRVLEREVQRAARLCEDSRDKVRQFFAALTVALDLGRAAGIGYSQRIRLDSKPRSQPAWSAVETAWDEAGSALADLAEALERLAQGLQELADGGTAVPEELLADLPNLAGQVATAYEQIHAAVAHPDRETIYWVEATASPLRVSVHSAPLHIGPLVEKHLFHQKENVILTSATLRTGDSYEYIRERLHAFDADTVTVGSPFDYRRSTLVFIPTDLSDPNSPAFQAQVEAAICELAKALDGRTMALFTSNDQLRRTAEAVSRKLQAAGIAVYQQGEGGSRRQLLENFRTNARSVLLGTRSFWEGVDVVGEALSGLVIAKLPFAVPTDPVVAARAETFDDPFYQYSVPDAILRFRQGFGRLIRSQTDRGVCVILDNRVLTKAYGRLFLQSLPECTVQRAPLSALSAAARAWLSAQG